MKRKIYFILFIGFVILAGVSAYQLISDQLDYKAATDYYDSFANSVVEYNSPAESEAPSDQTATETGSSSETAPAAEKASPSETEAAAETTLSAESTVPKNTALSAETEKPPEAAASVETTSFSGNAPAAESEPPAESETPATETAGSEVKAAVHTEIPTPDAQSVETETLSETEPASDTAAVQEASAETPKTVESQETNKVTQTKSPKGTVEPTKTVEPAEIKGKTETVKPEETWESAETVKPAEIKGATETLKPEETWEPAETVKPTEIAELSEPTETTSLPEHTLAPFKKIVVPKETNEKKEFPSTTEQPPITVDFEKLRLMNPEIVGWIYCEDTAINYPILQAKNNEKYLHYQPDGKTSKNGSIFIDYQCEPDFSSDNTLVYGHNRKNGMFAGLPRYEYQTYYEKHPVMWLLTPDRNYRVDLFAGFPVRANDWVYEIVLTVDKFKAEFVDRCLRSSKFKTSVVPDLASKLITLSTCHYDGTADARFVVIGTLIPCVE